MTERGVHSHSRFPEHDKEFIPVNLVKVETNMQKTYIPPKSVQPKDSVHPSLVHRGKTVMENKRALEEAKREIMQQMSTNRNYQIREI